MFCGLKSAILVLLLVCSILALTAMITDFWITIPSTFQYAGLFRICTRGSGCLNFADLDDVKNLLLSAFIIGLVFTLPFAIIELRYARTGGFGCLLIVGVFSSLIALLGFVAMIMGAVFFSSRLGSTYSYSWSFALGWLSVITAIATAAFSFYIFKVEPPIQSPEENTEAGALPGATTTPKPQEHVAIYFNRISRLF
ncbi:lens fiber membrane intrinsic -like [Pelobates cultripes]|uniref:Lens fiber membrane intrinsic -like n=1 Tax=Pelobates cultripes TaxID=61616 RepID=A0AAD1WL36_PELCU|nr:lens fiber membrane intrinsic -like [Pelobates cultripes]